MVNRFIVLGFSVFMTVSALQAETMSEREKNNLTISEVEISEISPGTRGEIFDDRQEIPFKMTIPGVIDPGKVIAVAKDLVALGEDVYKLVIKGKPSNTSKYAPISVVPKINGEAADVFELENFRTPVKHTYQIKFKNLYNVNVVVFRFSVIYSFGGSYDGKGAYITAAQIVPESVRTLFGFDFNATMKLGGVQNNGTRSNPNAGAILLLEYNVNSVMTAISKADSFFITGRGGFKKL